MNVFMRDSDAFTWYMERDPVLRSTVVAVAWLDRAPDWDVLAAKLEHATRLIPQFRQRILEPPARLATPRWTVDPDFDLSWHLRRVDAPAPRTPATVIAMARNAAMTAFDRTRPLWEFTLVEGLEDDRAALVMKLHHSLTDGLGGMQLMLTVFDVEPGPCDVHVAALDAPVGEQFGATGLVKASVARGVGRSAGAVRAGFASARSTAGRMLRDPVALVRRRRRERVLDRPYRRAGARPLSRRSCAAGASDAAPRHGRVRPRRPEARRGGRRRQRQRRLPRGDHRGLPPVPRSATAHRSRHCG